MVGSRVVRKLRRVLNGWGVPVGLLRHRHPSEAVLARWPRRSPYENTKHLYQAFAAHAPTDLYHLTEAVEPAMGPNDWFLGHPLFPVQPGVAGPTERTVRGPRRPRVLGLITPLHCRPEIDAHHITADFMADVATLLPRADVLFAIMGEYWWDQWDSSAYASWKPKIVRLDMAVDAQSFSVLKERFRPAGRRRFLYIGANEERKGSRFLEALFARCPDLECGWVGSGPDMPGIKRVSEFRALTPEFVAELAREYDFFISPSRVDPNPTTILECMAWGLPVLCTQQSGYYETEYRRNLYAEDLTRSEAVLRELQRLPEQALIEMSRKGREAVERDYSWSEFTRRVIEEFQARSVDDTSKIGRST